MSSRKNIPKGKKRAPKPTPPVEVTSPEDTGRFVSMCEMDSSSVVPSTSGIPSTSEQSVISAMEEKLSPTTDQTNLQTVKVTSVAEKVEQVEKNVEVSESIHNVPSETDAESTSDCLKGQATVEEIVAQTKKLHLDEKSKPSDEVERLIPQTGTEGEKTSQLTYSVSTSVDERSLNLIDAIEKVTLARATTSIETGAVDKDSAQKDSQKSSPTPLFKNRSPLRVQPIIFKRHSPFKTIESPVEIASETEGPCSYSIVHEIHNDQYTITYTSPPMVEVHFEDNDIPAGAKTAEDSDSEVFDIQLEDTNGVEHAEEALETTNAEINGSNGLVERRNERVNMQEVEVQTEEEEMERRNDQEVENITYQYRTSDAIDNNIEAGVRYISRPTDLERLDALERKSIEMDEIVARVMEHIEGPQAISAEWDRILNSVDFEVPERINVPWPKTRDLPTFDKAVEEAGAHGSREVEANAEALHQAIKDRENEPAPDDDIIMTGLANVVSTHGFRDYMSSAICKAIKTTLEKNITDLFVNKYLPVFTQAHDTMRNQIVESTKQYFIELSRRMVAERGPASGVKRRLNIAFNRDLRTCKNLIKATKSDAPSEMSENIATVIREVLEKEFAEWRKEVEAELTKLKNTMRSADGAHCMQASQEMPTDVTASGLAQSPLASQSLVSQLIKTAEINTMVNDGDINGAFEKALTAGDLALVMTACRAANPDVIFAPPSRLKQHVMLSLIQQLATDMAHDTQLKCRYLEEALINVDVDDVLIRRHLPTVATEVRGYLRTFLQKYPNHMCGRKIKLIIMAADSMIKLPPIF